jgi:hypothetical protein
MSDQDVRYWPTDKAIAELDRPHSPVERFGDVSVGDIVRIGKGKRDWRVAGFWTTAQGEVLADLEPHGTPGFTSASARPDRLTVIERAGATS